MEKKEAKKKNFKIDRDLLPVKVVYFAFDAGSHSVLAYRTIFYKHLGLSSYEVGLILLLECVFATIMIPAVGLITDKMKRPKSFIVSIILLGCASVSAQYLTPFAPSDQVTYTIPVSSSTTNRSAPLAPSCEPVGCRNVTGDGCLDDAANGSAWIDEEVTMCCEIRCQEESGGGGVRFSAAFTLTLAMVLLSSVAHRGADSLLQSSVLALLGERSGKFGRQLMWAACGGGAMIALVGLSKDLVEGQLPEGSIEGSKLMFLPMFVCNNLFWLIAALVTLKLPIKYEAKKKVQWGDIKKVLLDMRSIAFFLVVWAYGIDQALIQNYLFWFAEEKLASSGTMMGLSVLVGTLSVLPVFLVTGRVIARFGCDVILTFTMLTFAVRFYLYTILTESWQLLLMELFRTVSYALAWTTICTHASQIAPPGLQATIMAIVYSITRMIGSGTGAGLGGAIFNQYGGDYLFRMAALMSLVSAVLYQLSLLLLKITGYDRRKRDQESEDERKSAKMVANDNRDDALIDNEA